MILVYTTLSAQRSHPGRAHILSGITLLDGAPAQRRVVVMDRTTGGYIISTVTGDSGVLCFYLYAAADPAQTLLRHLF